MSHGPQQKINWQPMSALPLIASMIDGLADEVEKQDENLRACRMRPHVLDDFTVKRVIKVYTDQFGDLEKLYEEQLSRWKMLELDPEQRREVDRLAERIPLIKDRIRDILAIADELKAGTIDAVLAKDDVELGLEFLLGKRKP